jgi:hypothetical protein
MIATAGATLAWIGVASASLLFLYLAARLITTGILRSLRESRCHQNTRVRQAARQRSPYEEQ